jgi:hypothetical protein
MGTPAFLCRKCEAKLAPNTGRRRSLRQTFAQSTFPPGAFCPVGGRRGVYTDDECENWLGMGNSLPRVAKS